ncbi:hypothetical protein H4217_007785, partial [Coemansia sp. RSA 1939]
MFGRLNAKLAHLKANSQRTQTQGSGASLSPLIGASVSTAEGTPASPSVFGTASATTTPAVQSTATSRATSPPPSQISSFQAARVAASHAVAASKGLSLNIQSRQQQQQQQYLHYNPQQNIHQSQTSATSTGNPALKSYHLYVETPSENSLPPILSPTAATAPKGLVPSNKRRLSSPRVDAQTVSVGSNYPHQAKQSRLDSAVDTCESPVHGPQGAAAISDYQQHQLIAENTATVLNSAQQISYSPIPLPSHSSGLSHVSVAGHSTGPPTSFCHSGLGTYSGTSNPYGSYDHSYNSPLQQLQQQQKEYYQQPPYSSEAAHHLDDSCANTGAASHLYPSAYQHQQQQQQQQQQQSMLSQSNHHYTQYQPGTQQYTTQTATHEQQKPHVQDSNSSKAISSMTRSTPEVPRMVHSASATSGNQETYVTQVQTMSSDGRTLDDFQLLNTL